MIAQAIGPQKTSDAIGIMPSEAAAAVNTIGRSRCVVASIRKAGYAPQPTFAPMGRKGKNCGWTAQANRINSSAAGQTEFRIIQP